MILQDTKQRRLHILSIFRWCFQVALKTHGMEFQNSLEKCGSESMDLEFANFYFIAFYLYNFVGYFLINISLTTLC